MYSTLTYIIAYRAIDMIVQGLSEEKSIRIISDKGQELGQAIIENLDKMINPINAIFQNLNELEDSMVGATRVFMFIDEENDDLHI